MVVAIIVILGAFLWLLIETNWLRIRLPVYDTKPVIPSSDMRTFLGRLDAHGLLALAGIVGPLILITLDLTGAFIQPGYSITRQSMSSLAITSKGWIETIGFMLMGIMIESFTAALYLNIKRRRGFGLATALLVFFGFGMLVIGTFHTDAVGAPRTLSGYVHQVTAYGVFGLFPIALSLMLPSIKNDHRWRGMFIYTLVTIVIAVTLAVCQPFFTEQFHYYGIYERVMVLNAIAWLVTFAIRLLLLSFKLNKGRQT